MCLRSAPPITINLVNIYASVSLVFLFASSCTLSQLIVCYLYGGIEFAVLLLPFSFYITVAVHATPLFLLHSVCYQFVSRNVALGSIFKSRSIVITANSSINISGNYGLLARSRIDELSSFLLPRAVFLEKASPGDRLKSVI